MTDRDEARLARIQAVVTALIERRLAASLAELERAIAGWRAGDHGVLDAHDAAVRHVHASEALIKRVMAAAAKPDGVIRDAFDAEVIDADEVERLTGRPPAEIEPAGSLAVPIAPPPDKRAVIDDLLGKGAVLVHLDARRSDVAVPERLRGESKLVLRLGHGLSPPIPDLLVDDRGISATLTFGGAPFRCVMPWAAIYAAVADGEQRGMVWPDDIPDDLLTGGPGEAAPEVADQPPPRSKRPSHLKLVD